MAAGTDYDALRVREDADPDEQMITGLTTRRLDSASGSIDVDDSEPVFLSDDPFLLDEPGLPVQAQRGDEFTCSRCFLVVHRTRYARTLRGKPICRDCG